MNVAICFSGQNRSDKINYNFLDNIKNYDNLDIFVHLWSDTINEKLIENFKPKKYVFESQKNFEEESLMFCKPFYKNKVKMRFVSNVTNWEWIVSSNKTVSKRILFGKECKTTENQNIVSKNILDFGRTAHSMFYSIYYCNELKNLYERTNKIKYDLVIRARPDSFLQTPLDLNEIDVNYLYTMRSSRYINDIFAIASKENMDAYCSTYLNLTTLLFDFYNNQRDSYLCMESLLHQSLLNQNVDRKLIDNVVKTIK